MKSSKARKKSWTRSSCATRRRCGSSSKPAAAADGRRRNSLLGAQPSWLRRRKQGGPRNYPTSIFSGLIFCNREFSDRLLGHHLITQRLVHPMPELLKLYLDQMLRLDVAQALRNEGHERQGVTSSYVIY